MKILFNCLSMEKGGAERVISVLSNKFIESNQVTLVTLIKSKPKYKLDKRIKLLQIDEDEYLKASKIKKKLIKLSYHRLTKLLKVVIKERPDIIISFLPEPSMRIMLLKKLSKKIRDIPTIISIRNNPETEYKNKFIYAVMKYLYKDVDTMVLQTKEAKEYFSKIIKNEKKLVVISNPINEKFLIEKPYEGERDKIIVTVGRLEKQKNQKLLIEAFKKVESKHTDYKLLIYGEGSLQKELQEYVDELKLADKVIFKGKKDDIEKEIFKAGIFVLSSDYEGMPNALMEAMALGLPCISTDCPCGGPRTLIDNNNNGILVKVNDSEKMAEAINFLIENKNEAQQMGKKANKIKDKCSLNKIYKKWIEVIERLK